MRPARTSWHRLHSFEPTHDAAIREARLAWALTDECGGTGAWYGQPFALRKLGEAPYYCSINILFSERASAQAVLDPTCGLD